MRIREPVVQRHKSDLRAVSDHEEYEGQREDSRVEPVGDSAQVRPEEAVCPFAEDLFRGEVKKYRAEKGLRDPYAAKDEVLPRGLYSRWRAVERDKEDGRKGSKLHRYPQDADVVGKERKSMAKMKSWYRK